MHVCLMNEEKFEMCVQFRPIHVCTYQILLPPQVLRQTLNSTVYILYVYNAVKLEPASKYVTIVNNNYSDNLIVAILDKT